MPAMPLTSLYVHVPFCARKCHYCAFYSEPARAGLLRRYVAALCRDMEAAANRLRPHTVYFGGGTPSLLSLSQWRSILDTMSRLHWLGAVEWTLECNPATVSPEKARLWRDYGVNRVSLGVQSLEDALLKRLGRVHSRRMVFQTFETLRAAGFDNLGLDLMFAIPGQTLEMWRATLHEALALAPEHLSAYELTFEEDTPLYHQLRAGQFSVSEDLACAMYDALLEDAAARGLAQYEISNFARHTRDRDARAPAPADPGTVPAFACRHNLNYWRGGPFLGLGPSAATHLDGVRTTNWPDTTLYCERIEQGQPPAQTRDELPPLSRAGEIAAFGLRMTAGWRFDEFERATGFDLRREWPRELGQLVDCGWGRLDAERFRLTREGLRFADTVAQLFLRVPAPP
ncbi:MAG: radical SAM family heme chaperone HemW [Verrucomicrobia bacterium]|nr:radical SAM family heme chaperone HemW [Verrucomicrobiota bacterium]